MQPAEFPEQTEEIAKNQPQYLTVPSYRYPGPQGEIVCRWKLSWSERLQLLWRGDLWQRVLTFHKPLQPQHLSLDKPKMPK